MKIAFIYDMIYPFNIGGVELRNFEIAKRLTKNHEVHLFGVKLWQGPDVIKKDGITIHGVCKYGKTYNFKGVRTIFEPLKFAIKLYKPLKKEKFDLIDTSTFVYFHCFTCKLISTLNKTPLIFTWHQYWGNYWYEYLGFIKGFFGKLIERLVKNFTNFHVAISKTTKNDLIKIGLAEKNIFLSYDGVNLELVESIPKQEKIYDLIFVGRLIHQKNVSLLIKATQILKKDFPNIKIAIVGDGPDKNDLIALTKKLNLENNVLFLGFLPELKQVYKKMKQSKIFVLPSLLEGFGIVVAEAMACSLPIVLVNSPWSASKELINEKLNGSISKNDPENLAQNIKNILNNNQKITNMGQHSHKLAQKFSWQNTTSDIETYYQEMINLWKQN